MKPFPTLADMGIGKTQSHRWQLISGIPEDRFEDYIVEIICQPDELNCSCKLMAGCIRP
jgi:hypothetical protein